MIKNYYICIKPFKDEDGEVEKGKKYLLIKSVRFNDIWYVVLGKDEDGVSIFGPAILENKIPKFFISVAEFRDNQINSILDE